MKPCSTNRKLIAELALNSASALAEERLRGHFKSCPGCRAYFDEMSRVTNVLSAPTAISDISTSEAFHRKVLSRLEGPQHAASGESVLALLLNWRLVAPALVTVILIVAAFALRPHHSDLRVLTQGAPSVSVPKKEDEIDPTVANYQRIANRSLDTLDALLSRQAGKNPPHVPVYTASAVTRAAVLD